MISSLLISIAISMTSTTSQVAAVNCAAVVAEVAKKERELDIHSLALKKAERVFAPEAKSYELDDGTVADLDLDTLVYPHINKTKTVFGAERLFRLLHNPILDVHEIRERQEAVAELMADPKLFQEVSAILSSLRRSAEGIHAHFLGDQNHRTNVSSDRVFGLIGPAMNATAIGSAIASHHWQYAMMGLYPSMLFQPHTVGSLQTARWYLLQYKNLFESSAKLGGLLSQAKSPLLRRLAEQMKTTGGDNSSVPGIQMFQKLLTGKQAIALDWIYSHSAWTLGKHGKVIEGERENIAKLLGAVAELDVFSSFAEIASPHSSDVVFPTIVNDTDPRLVIEGGHNPYIYLARGNTSVSNDIRLDSSSSRNGDSNFLILTGPNMGGKSTYLKMASISAILAQMGAPVFAKRMEMTPLQIVTNINVSDSIAQGKSFFDAETDRLKGIIEMTDQRPGMLVIMDEILLGTNPEEREAAERAIINYLASKRQLFVLATHDLRVTELSKNVAGVSNSHVEEQVDQGKLIFSYRVKTGPTPSRNAITVLKIKGFPTTITDEAQQWLDRKANSAQTSGN